MEKILMGEETRTNIMVKNIPCRYTYQEIKNDFDKNHKGHFNDLKLPVDTNNQGVKTNRSFCFINMRHILYVYEFIFDKKNYHWPKYQSDKTIDICFAVAQPMQTNVGASNITDQDRQELKRIYDKIKDTRIPVENFTGMQSMVKPKYNGGTKTSTNRNSKRSHREDNYNGTPSKQFNNSFVNVNL